MPLIRTSVLLSAFLLPCVAHADCSPDAFGGLRCTDGTRFSPNLGSDHFNGTDVTGNPVQGTVHRFGDTATITVEPALPNELYGGGTNDDLFGNDPKRPF